MISHAEQSTPSLDACGSLALGCWAFGRMGWGDQQDADSQSAMEAAWDAGIRHWDTALAYGDGHSERLVGAFLRDKRDRALLATKGVPGDEPDSVIGILETSLRNLGTDHIDLYYIHWPRHGIDLRPHAERLERARERGLIGKLGVSNFSPDQMDHIGEVCRIDVHQTCMNVFWRRAEQDVLPYCAERSIPVVAYSPLAQGILAGRFAATPVFGDNDWRGGTVFFRPDVWPALHAATQELNELAADIRRPVHHLALQWLVHRAGMAAVIVGVRNARQAADSAAALDGELSADVLDAVTAISDRVRPRIPDERNIFAYDP